MKTHFYMKNLEMLIQNSVITQSQFQDRDQENILGYSIGNLNGITIMVMGGSWSFQDKNGPFFYGCDRYINQSQQAAYSARIMFIPTKNAIYDANITKWTQRMGG